MATAPVNIAPVLTPHTLGVLADGLQESEPAKASFLRELQPFLQGLVNRCFVPLTAISRERTFIRRFDELSKDFEPFRLHLNALLMNAFQGQDFLAVYDEMLHEVFDPLLSKAREMNMQPELIAAAVRDYLKIVQTLKQLSDADAPMSSESAFERFSAFVNCVQAATQLDYGLTAIFLILEGAIPEPAITEKKTLLSAYTKSLLGFGQALSKLISSDQLRDVLSNLEIHHIQPQRFTRGIKQTSLRSSEKQETNFPYPRQAEWDWLARNKNLSEHFGGQWIVIEKDELIANDADYEKAHDIATQKGIKRPFIIFVPINESAGFMGI